MIATRWQAARLARGLNQQGLYLSFKTVLCATPCRCRDAARLRLEEANRLVDRENAIGLSALAIRVAPLCVGECSAARKGSAQKLIELRFEPLGLEFLAGLLECGVGLREIVD